MTNAEVAKNPEYADFSLDQSQLGVEDFYDRMDDVMSLSPLDPTRAMKEAITSLEERADRVPEIRRRARRAGDVSLHARFS